MVKERIYTRLALYGSKNECAKTHTVFLAISEVCDGTVSLKDIHTYGHGDLQTLNSDSSNSDSSNSDSSDSNSSK